MIVRQYEVRSYKSPTLRRTVYQVVYTSTGQWVYESLYKPSCVERCKQLNARPVTLEPYSPTATLEAHQELGECGHDDVQEPHP